MQIKNKTSLFLAFIILPFFSELSIANNTKLCPERMICSRDDDIASCQCQTKNLKLPNWTPKIIEENHIYEGEYVFHNTSVAIGAGSKNTKTYCTMEYTNPHADDKLNCEYQGGNLIPDRTKTNQWITYINNVNEVIFSCGDYNFGTHRESCVFLKRSDLKLK